VIPFGFFYTLLSPPLLHLDLRRIAHKHFKTANFTVRSAGCKFNLHKKTDIRTKERVPSHPSTQMDLLKVTCHLVICSTGEFIIINGIGLVIRVKCCCFLSFRLGRSPFSSSFLLGCFPFLHRSFWVVPLCLLFLGYQLLLCPPKFQRYG